MLRITLATLLYFAARACGTVIHINDTQFSQLPPLYGLDDWAQCQQPDDMWCMVDAALHAEGPSPALELLQEYSKVTLKHYNRTQVHRGLCVSRCGPKAEGESAWHEAARVCLQRDLAQYNLTAEVLSVSWCSSTRLEPTSGAAALAILLVVLLALALLATTLHVLGERCAKSDGNKYLLAFSMKKNWEILTYDRSKPRSDDRMKDLTCIEGIRYPLIAIYHRNCNGVFNYKIHSIEGNLMYVLQFQFKYRGLGSEYDFVPFGVETLGPWGPSAVRLFMEIAKRLTPVAGVALWFTISWYPLLGAGPQWSWLVTRESHDCAERWWYHILYVHNHLPMGKFCMGHTWYLAADMQLHVIGLIVLLVVLRWRTLVAPVLGVLVLGSALASGLVTYLNQLTPIVTGQAPEVLRTMFFGSKILSLVYLPSWMNLAGYVSGMATAFVLHHLQCAGVKLNQNKWFNILFHLSLTLGSVVVMAGAVFLREGGGEASWASALYSAVDRPLVAACFSAFMLGCFVRCKSALRDMFEWRGFHSLGRLSYCVFVIHFIVLRLTLAGNTQLNHASIYSLITLLISVSILSYVAAIPCCLLIELPAIELWRAITHSDRREQPSVVQEPPQPAVKPLDLVAGIQRRQEPERVASRKTIEGMRFIANIGFLSEKVTSCETLGLGRRHSEKAGSRLVSRDIRHAGGKSLLLQKKANLRLQKDNENLHEKMVALKKRGCSYEDGSSVGPMPKLHGTKLIYLNGCGA
ncbi:hypothetical protein evm_010997 [Chilo suppressalis]|nr:hypothetical protein evm_010997 [Chilo suppressalis]